MNFSSLASCSETAVDTKTKLTIHRLVTLQETLPAAMGEWKNLRRLDLADNHLEEIPLEVSNTTLPEPQKHRSPTASNTVLLRCFTVSTSSHVLICFRSPSQCPGEFTCGTGACRH